MPDLRPPRPGWQPTRTAAALLIGLVLLAAGCSEETNNYFQGYAEGDFVLVAAPGAGRLIERNVRRGDQVEAGTPLFTIDREAEAAALRESEERLREAQKRLDDLRKGERPSELDAIRARLAQARASRERSQSEWERRQQLFAERFISAEELEQARTALVRDREAVAAQEAELKTARLGGRIDAVAAAEAEVEAARAAVDQARWAFDEKRQSAPAAGLIFDTLFEPGEFVPAGRPVVSLLPPGNLKLRFFVPEPVVGTLQPGGKVNFSFDGGPGPLSADISYISPRAEYTPPVIYSRESRQKLVFLVEARPEPADSPRLHPGQPVEVRLAQ